MRKGMMAKKGRAMANRRGATKGNVAERGKNVAARRGANRRPAAGRGSGNSSYSGPKSEMMRKGYAKGGKVVPAGASYKGGKK